MIALNFSFLAPQQTRSPYGDDGDGDGSAGSCWCQLKPTGTWKSIKNGPSKTRN